MSSPSRTESSSPWGWLRWLRFLLIVPIYSAYQRRTEKELRWRLAFSHVSAVLLSVALISVVGATIIVGTAIVIDCHSMPSVGVSREEPARPDVVIGDRYGTSCTAILRDRVEETLGALGYSIGRNKPYAGGFITEHYGNPASGLHAIQIELNRAIYMDERRRERGPRFAAIAADFTALAEALATLPFSDFGPFQAAAE